MGREWGSSEARWVESGTIYASINFYAYAWVWGGCVPNESQNCEGRSVCAKASLSDLTESGDLERRPKGGAKRAPRGGSDVEVMVE